VDTNQRARKVELAIRLYVTLGVSLAALVALLSRPIILIMYGQEFLPAAPLLRFTAAAQAMQIIAYAMQNLMAALGRPMLATAIFGITLAVNIGGNLLLMPRFGGMGAAVAIALAALTHLIAATAVAKRLCGFRLAHSFIPRTDDLRRVMDALRW